MCNGRKFCSEFFTQLFVRISGAIRLNSLIWVLLGKSFPPGEVEMMLILGKSDDVRRLAKACHGLHGSQWVKVELQNSKTKAAKISC